MKPFRGITNSLFILITIVISDINDVLSSSWSRSCLCLIHFNTFTSSQRLKTLDLRADAIIQMYPPPPLTHPHHRPITFKNWINWEWLNKYIIYINNTKVQVTEYEFNFLNRSTFFQLKRQNHWSSWAPCQSKGHHQILTSKKIIAFGNFTKIISYFSELRSNKAVNYEVDGRVEDDKISAKKFSQPIIIRQKVDVAFMETVQNCWNSEDKKH